MAKRWGENSRRRRPKAPCLLQDPTPPRFSSPASRLLPAGGGPPLRYRAASRPWRSVETGGTGCFARVSGGGGAVALVFRKLLIGWPAGAGQSARTQRTRGSLPPSVPWFTKLTLADS